MTNKVHLSIQTVAMILQILNALLGVVPDKYKPIVAGMIAAIQLIAGRIAHNSNPDGTPASVAYVAKLLLLCLLLAPMTMAQTPAPPDVPISHVSITATFTGYDSGGKMTPANIDTFGVQFTKNVNLAYEHIQIPSLSQRWELGLVAYSFTFPKIKALLFDSSNFVGTVSAGAGKFLSSEDGNHFAYTAAGSITYPIAAHMGWQILSYQYVKATGLGSGVINRSYQTASTGPVFYF